MKGSVDNEFKQRRTKVKLLGAVIGGSAVVTMGALAMSIHQQPAAPQQRRGGPDDDGARRRPAVEARTTPSRRRRWPCPSSRARHRCRQSRRPPSSGRHSHSRFTHDPSGYPIGRRGRRRPLYALFDRHRNGVVRSEVEAVENGVGRGRRQRRPSPWVRWDSRSATSAPPTRRSRRHHPARCTTSEITTGATVTDTTEMNGPKTSVAVPPITTPPSDDHDCRPRSRIDTE